MDNGYFWMSYDFNSRTHVECDQKLPGLRLVPSDFNSRTHVECDRLPFYYILGVKISTHALTWSATLSCYALTCSSAFQLTHSRGVRQNTAITSRLTVSISTHALTWSATRPVCGLQGRTEFQLTHSRGVRPLAAVCPAMRSISTHALTWSATRSQ